jgi:hypothetical protein
MLVNSLHPLCLVLLSSGISAKAPARGAASKRQHAVWWYNAQLDDNYVSSICQWSSSQPDLEGAQATWLESLLVVNPVPLALFSSS